MAFFTTFTILLLLVVLSNLAESRFDKYYVPLWGQNHLSVNPQGTQVQLMMDKSSGAGFRSKLEYGSGLFHIRMKIPDKKTGGIVTTFYLTSAPDYQEPGNHFELDYEFLGTNGTVQTNVYDNDGGHREESFKLWFDPSKDFHTYEILWNSHQIVAGAYQQVNYQNVLLSLNSQFLFILLGFTVDKIPVRVFKNNTARGIAYPSKPMHIEASIWNADWAGKVDWTQAPFTAYFQDFDFYACSTQGDDVSRCASEGYFWNGRNYWELTSQQKQLMQNYRRLYMSYDYCSSPSTRKEECSLNV